MIREIFAGNALTKILRILICDVTIFFWIRQATKMIDPSRKFSKCDLKVHLRNNFYEWPKNQIVIGNPTSYLVKNSSITKYKKCLQQKTEKSIGSFTGDQNDDL